MAIEQSRRDRRGADGHRHRPCLALAGYDVVLDDVNKEQLQGRTRRRSKEHASARPARGMIDEADRKPALARIDTTQTLDDSKDRDW